MQRYLQERDRYSFTSSTPDGLSPPFRAFPEHLVYGFSHRTSDDTPEGYHPSYRLPSPSSSGLRSSGASSNFDDPQDTARSTPGLSPAPRYLRPSEMPTAAYGDHTHSHHDDFNYTHSGVAMHDVQWHRDDATVYDEESAGYSLHGSQAQEGYEPMSEEQALETNYNIPSGPYPPYEYESRQAASGAPTIHGQRPQAIRSVTSPIRATRGAGGAQPGRRSSDRTGVRPEIRGAFPCPLQTYGCTSTFSSKNEWKRHVATQHMRLCVWRCIWCTDHINEFNRKDLFIQHLRRKHRQELGLQDANVRASERDTREDQVWSDASARCYIELRSPPHESHCLMCDVHFQGPGSWDQRMDHMGRHLESARRDPDEPINSQDWRDDPSTRAWLADKGVIVRNGTRWCLAAKP